MLSFLSNFPITGRAWYQQQQRLKFFTLGPRTAIRSTITTRKEIHKDVKESLKMCISSTTFNESKKSIGKGLLLGRIKQRNLGNAVSVESRKRINKNLVNKNLATSITQENQQQITNKLDDINKSNLGKDVHINVDHVNIRNDDGCTDDSRNDWKVVKDGREPFSSLDISSKTKKAIEQVLHYNTMSQVQQEAIPAVLSECWITYIHLYISTS